MTMTIEQNNIQGEYIARFPNTVDMYSFDELEGMELDAAIEKLKMALDNDKPLTNAELYPTTPVGAFT